MAFKPQWLQAATAEQTKVNFWPALSRTPMVKDKLTEAQRRGLALRRNGSRHRRMAK